MNIVLDLLRVLRVDTEAWDAFCSVGGGPRNDLRLLAAMAPCTIPQICASCLLPSGDGLSPVQATQVGLMWRNARWVVHLTGGGDPSLFIDRDPWMPETSSSRIELGKQGERLEAWQHPGPNRRLRDEDAGEGQTS